ncbi:hypothetical protein LOZ53_005536 [Ophidiomyces ophidiicola]|nr:hypothetical protein LOZ55_006397 [Ophidiomyces ophidiicola]KAI1984214.1 hypothetical protein LOZ53_005536 [Ophidiomyces ophidiicola]KAI1984791.1 hypothetical protein LOZ54_004414 [Ophidiomyces ophidiicola]KAI1985697.1 hypothetical protein LOZ51_006316 [Ophidiomyces ophidiicola]
MAEAQPPTDPHTYNGGCHCGAVRYQVVLDRANLQGGRCNCTICHKKGSLIFQVSESTVTLLKPASFTSPELGDYTFGSGSAHHYFCKTCGVSMFAKSSYVLDGKAADFLTVNGLTIDQSVGDEGETEEEGKLDLSGVKVRYWNGLMNDWKGGLRDEPFPGGCL